MIERLKESGGWTFGFKVTGRVTAEDVKAFEPQLSFAIAERKKRPLGILADVSEMDGIDLKARWEELHFLRKYSDHIARVALVGAKPWEEVVSTFIGGTVLFAAETHYFQPSEIQQAWLWVKTAKHANDVPVRPIYQGGIWKDYTEEFNL
jgi:SpoIIAA-like